MEISDKIGYCCINQTLEPKGIKVNRGMIKKTFDEKGLPYVSELVIANLKDTIEIIKWNEQNNIRNYRLSSDTFSWFTHYELKDLPNFDKIKNLLSGMGKLIKSYKHKVSYHPGQFNVLCSPRPDVVEKTIYELNQHALIMDLMELDMNPFYNINIHVGGVYGDKKSSMERFCNEFEKLSSSAKARLTVENDDSPNGYTVDDLFDGVYEKIKTPIVFDSLHHFCNDGGVTAEKALNIATKTWGYIIPEVHHSSSKKLYEDEKTTLKSHADYIYDKFVDYGGELYISIEAKGKELAVKKYKEQFF
jgi:UV DNA damage endonuclease